MEIRSVSSAAALRVALIVVGVIIVLRFLWIAHAIFVVGFLGVLFGLAVSRAVDHLERIRIPRAIGAPLIIIVALGVLVGGGALLAPYVQVQAGQLGEEMPKLLDSLVQSVGPYAQTLRVHLAGELRNAVKFLFPIVGSVLGGVSGFVLILFVAMYIAAQPGLYKEGLLHLVPHAHRERVSEVLTTLGATLRQWLIARLIAMLLVGTLTGLGLALLHVKGAAALGVLAGLLEFVPFFGPIASAVPAVGVALLESPQKALWVLGLYVLMQQLEGNVITPLLLEKRLDIPPVLTVLTVASLGVVFGVAGMLIAEPLLAVALVATKMLYVTDVVGDEVKIGKQS